MKKSLLISLLIVLALASASLAGMGMRGSIIKEKPDGESVKAVYYGDIMLGKDRSMNSALVKALGQFILPEPSDALELRTSSPISAITKKAIEVDIEGDKKSFQITPETRFCDFNGNKVERNSFHINSIATISSKMDGKAASTIRKGPLYFSGVMAGSPVLKDIDCKR